MTAQAAVATETKGPSTTLQRPIDSIKIGHDIEVATWKQDGPNGCFEIMSVTRSYTDKDGASRQQQLTNVTPDQLLAICQATGKAYLESMLRLHDKARAR